ncbi:DoxX family protein [Caulobacter segnis]|uniref:DoxX family protein n=1 Tax=Caulobacter segnis TaxID=88688 RepID=UPI0024108B46|nr:DoxX family protein [Caulobacter segnis]MDG2522621.1 DoxX family protein [Caulobacter segnis]
MGRWLFLDELSCLDDAALLVLRAVVGAFLIWGVWDNITSAEHMATFVAFLGKFGFPAPALMAPLSVWAQFACGLAFVLGAFTRWAGLLCAINFIVAIVMVDRTLGIRGSFTSACLVLIGLYLASHGPGRFALDQWLRRRLA